MGLFKENSVVIHDQYGQCTFMGMIGDMALIRTEDGTIQQCSSAALVPVNDIWNSSESFSTSNALLRLQGNLIKAINNAWGVFSQTAINLLPHQLWVCNQTMKQWPTRMMIADDVGLGKTIEAGLILTSAITSGKAHRILILTPAKLTIQWRERMESMFGQHFDIYTSASDKLTEGEFRKNKLIASLATVRLDGNDKHKRLLEADPWDIVMVDEAHHAGTSKEKQTLGFKLLDKMQASGKIKSLLFFTATPHQGKPEQFWKLMSLLDEEAFSKETSEKEKYERLPDYMIRNAKSKVTDMDGTRLCTELHQHPGVFHYTEQESAFYALMSEYIECGFAYAKELDDEEERHVGLVLTALQKIASSSITAIRSAFKKRLVKLEEESKAKSVIDEDDDEAMATETQFVLMKDEIGHIRELLRISEGIAEESGINRIIEIIKSDYPNDSVLLFTEYKATQALMIQTLRKHFCKNCVCFINGDDALYIDGHKEISPRMQAMKSFNSGRCRFLVSTEASGEGVDLQENCHVLIHVDLPWNPMRLHQRVGRIYRYGQTKDVDVVTLHNPDNLESRIWELLDEKCTEINKAFGHVMDSPEDMKQMVLGVEDPGFYSSLFSKGIRKDKETLSSWFDAKTKSLGNQAAIDTIRGIETRAARFDLSALDDVPKFELDDLKSFLEAVFRHDGKAFGYSPDGKVMTFRMPEGWAVNNQNYFDPLKVLPKEFEFNRKSMGKIPGIGNRFFDKALDDALACVDNYARIPGNDSYIIFKVVERDTTKESLSFFSFVGYRVDQNGNIEKESMSDLFRLVRDLLSRKYPDSDSISNRSIHVDRDLAESLKERATRDYRALGIEYDFPEAQIFALLDAAD